MERKEMAEVTSFGDMEGLGQSSVCRHWVGGHRMGGRLGARG